MSTLIDIANLCNVSTATVSYVLNNRGDENRISKDTQKKVLSVASQLGYIKKPQANITLFGLNKSMEMIATELFRGINQALLYENTRFNFNISPFEANSLRYQENLWEDDSIDVAIIYGLSKLDLEYIEQNPPTIPLILINRYLPRHHSVTINHDSVGELVANHAVRKGKDDIIVVLGSNNFYGFQLRNDAIIEKLNKLGVNLKNKKEHTENTIEDGYNLGLKLLLQGKLPKVIVCIYDMVAFGLLSAFAENNVKVGKDVEIVATCSSSKELFAKTYPPLTVVDLKIYETVLRSINLAIDILDEKVIENVLIEVDPTIEYRESSPY